MGEAVDKHNLMDKRFTIWQKRHRKKIEKRHLLLWMEKNKINTGQISIKLAEKIWFGSRDCLKSYIYEE